MIWTSDISCDGAELKTILSKRLHLTNNIITRLKHRPDGMLINGKKAISTDIVHTGDVISVSISQVTTFDPASKSIWAEPADAVRTLPILYEDPDLIFLNKPGGIVMHPSHGHYNDSCANFVAYHLGISRGGIYPVGRLDRDTSGLVCFAKHVDASGMMAVEQHENIYHKTYICLVSGIINSDGEVDAPIGIDPASAYPDGSPRVSGTTPRRMVKVISSGGRPALTRYHVLGHARIEINSNGNIDSRDVTLLQVTITHGRTHQIRVHMSYLMHPVVGDILYSKDEANQVIRLLNNDPAFVSAFRTDLPKSPKIRKAFLRTGLCLHAYKADLLKPFSREKLEVTAPVILHTSTGTSFSLSLS